MDNCSRLGLKRELSLEEWEGLIRDIRQEVEYEEGDATTPFE